MTEAQQEERGAWRGLWLALLAGLVLRAAFLVERRAEPDFAHPVVDAGFHDFWARRAAGLEVAPPAGKPDPELATTPCLRPPAYPWLLGLVYRAGGDGPLPPRLLNHALGLATAALVGLFARRAFGRAAGTAAALIAALHWAPVFFEGELQAEPLFQFLLLACLCAAQRVGASSGGWLLTGLLGGAAATARPNALLPLALVGAWLGWRQASGRLRAWCLFAVGVVLAVLPVSLRNLAASGEFVPLTTAGGINLFLGQRAGASGLIDGDLGELGRFDTCFDYPNVVAELEAREGRPLSATEVDHWFRARGTRALLDQPGRALRLTGRKLLLNLGPVEVGHNREVGEARARSRVLRWLPFPFPVLLALALCGGWLASRARGPRASDARLLALFAVGWLVSLLPFFAAARYRAPLVPLLAPLAGLACVRLLKRRGALVPLLVAAALASALAAGAWATGVRSSPARWWLDRGRAQFSGGDLDAARASFEEALRLVPEDPAARFELGITLHAAGDEARAAGAYREVLEVDPAHAKAAFNLGSLAQARGAWVRAARLYGQAVQAQPTLTPAREALMRAALVLCAAPEPAPKDAAVALVAADLLLARPGAVEPELRYLRAAALAEAARFEEALAELARSRRARGAGAGPPDAQYDAAAERFRDRRPLRIGP